ncbi:MAG: hypothetical protein HOE76_03810 [Euryarchaeota archaeon]|nr:hypothetical protein [Euryarchaeota archaeon]MBT4982239.1 hypothetical protein [Euryarchaeota archaeon]
MMTGSQTMVTLQERLVNLINQLSMPVLESSLVISRWTNRLLRQLQDHSNTVPENLAAPWPLDSEPVTSESTFDLEKALSLVDRDRMDILDTLIRVTLEEEEMLVSDALGVMRSWEHLVRGQLSQASGPGQLFSPTEIPEEF